MDDEEDKILAKIGALQKAQSAVKNQHPPDIDTFRQLASLISDLHLRLQTVASAPQIPQLSAQDVQNLQAAINTLETAVNQSAGATQILQAASALANS
jgi:flagellar biosynthesis chaperone FliJ